MIINRLGSSDEFNTVDISIKAPAVGSAVYQAVLSIPDAAYTGQAEFKIDLQMLADLENDTAGYGLALGQALFARDGLGFDYGKALAIAQNDHKGLHVRLAIEPAEMQALHWERIYQQVGTEWFPLGSNADTPLSRWTPSTTQMATPAPVSARPLLVLAVIASPADLSSRFGLDPISPEERQKLHRNLESLGEVHVTYLESGTASPPTMDNLRQALGKVNDFVHFLCHGAVAPGGTVLYLEKANGSADPISAEGLLEIFQPGTSAPALCFLSACESAMQDRHDAFLSLGPDLVRMGGVQATVAMSDKIGLETAQVFTSQFYTRLMVHGLVDKAVNEARALVRDRWDWGVPVLFSRIEDNRLVDFPIDGQYSQTLKLSGGTANTARKVLDLAREQNESLKSIQDIEELIIQLDDSQTFLGGVASDFQGTGEDTQTFAGNFNGFSGRFKPMYLKKTWTKEIISCKQIQGLGQLILAEMQTRLPPALYQELKLKVDEFSGTDDQFIDFTQNFLEKMNRAVNDINKKLREGNVEEAIQKKIDFDEQIERMLKKGRKYLASMAEATHGARAA